MDGRGKDVIEITPSILLVNSSERMQDKGVRKSFQEDEINNSFHHFDYELFKNMSLFETILHRGLEYVYVSFHNQS